MKTHFFAFFHFLARRLHPPSSIHPTAIIITITISISCRLKRLFLHLLNFGIDQGFRAVQSVSCEILRLSLSYRVSASRSFPAIQVALALGSHFPGSKVPYFFESYRTKPFLGLSSIDSITTLSNNYVEFGGRRQAGHRRPRRQTLIWQRCVGETLSCSSPTHRYEKTPHHTSISSKNTRSATSSSIEHFNKCSSVCDLAFEIFILPSIPLRTNKSYLENIRNSKTKSKNQTLTKFALHRLPFALTVTSTVIRDSDSA